MLQKLGLVFYSTIIAAVFQDRVTSVYSLTQGAFGFAEILGPSIGGILFEVYFLSKTFDMQM